MSDHGPKLQLYNTLTRAKAPFEPLDAGHVRMYVCGPTVYDFAHIGNARPVIVFDVLFRLLNYLADRNAWGAKKTKVTYVRNITDVDDKINARALRDYPDLPLNDAIAKVTQKTADQFHADVKALGCLLPTHEPRATDNIDQMQEMIAALLAKGHAYEAEGEVLFDTASMADYGQLSNRKLEEQQAGARVEVDAHKRNAGDFVLWKASNENEPGWDSPWGRGRPGWHIECSAMSNRYLWDAVKDKLSDGAKSAVHQFDIHGGGLDLIFPHHENEIAQSRCAHGSAAMAQVWMHNGFLQVEGEKMSKSLGNFITINELLEKWPGELVRYQMLMTSYRQPIDWTEHNCNIASLALVKFSRLLRSSEKGDWQPQSDFLDPDFLGALCDDLNTPAAIAVLHKICDDFTKSSSADLIQQNRLDALHNGLEILGFTDPAGFETQLIEFKRQGLDISKDEIGELIAARAEARAAKNWAEGDRIRDELAKMGIQLKDAKNPDTGEIETTWEVKR
ncbi:MAG: cysteine--tRNA ligase [Alphaproteobacteria bacterium]|nr:cysteine--tRNA ligase [Alphaproteobacteria bacterium]